MICYKVTYSLKVLLCYVCEPIYIVSFNITVVTAGLENTFAKILKLSLSYTISCSKWQNFKAVTHSSACGTCLCKCISTIFNLAIRQGFVLSRMTSFTLHKQSQRSRSIIYDGSRFLGLFWKEKHRCLITKEIR